MRRASLLFQVLSLALAPAFAWAASRIRTTRAIPVGFALALAPGRASADPPHVELRLEYVRGSGGATCPAEPTLLRAEVAASMGYDPFEGASAPERLEHRTG